MKKIILSIALVTGLSLVSQAQNSATPAGKDKGGAMKNATPEEKAKHHADKMAKELGLTPDQKTKWEAAALERMKANAPLHEKMKGSTTPEERKTLHTQAKANMDKFDATVGGFLTPEQKTKFDKMKEDRKNKAMEKHKAAKGDVHEIDED